MEVRVLEAAVGYVYCRNAGIDERCMVGCRPRGLLPRNTGIPSEETVPFEHSCNAHLQLPTIASDVDTGRSVAPRHVDIHDG